MPELPELPELPVTRQEAGPEGDASADLPDSLLKGRLYERLFPSVQRPATRLGRFVLLRELGRGGMGVVLSGYDEQLDRKVAIKLLHPEASRDEAARARLLREAQALARLSHPNVVQVHEAGVNDGQVYLVMEYVEGVELRTWLHEHAPSSPRACWRMVLETMIAAGEGLAAAHEAGLLHRDFKPENVLVGKDGRVRVADFGLATEGAVSEAGASEAGASAAGQTVSEARVASSTSSGETPRPLERVTRTGLAVGTAAYMPLEQLRGGVVDGRSDQFSFCVTLYEALFGVRPFEGTNLAAIELALEDGQPKVPAEVGAVPRWLRKAVWRGLCREPEERFADMRALLSALAHGRRRWRSLALAGGAATIGLAGVAMGLGLPSSTDPCARADEDLAMAWSDTTRQSMRTAFEATELPFATQAAGRMMSELDAMVGAWRAEQVDACEDTYVRRTHPVAMLGLRTLCIERNTQGLRALLRRLSHADAALVEHAEEALSVLPDSTLCADVEALELGLAPPKDPEAVAEIRAHLASVRLDLLIGRQTDVRAGLQAQVERARDLDDAPVLAETLWSLSTVLMQRGQHDEAEARLWDAIDLAERARHDELVPELWLGMAELADRFRRDPEQAMHWLRRADATIARGHDHGRTRVIWFRSAGHAEYGMGRLEVAEDLLRRGLDEVSDVPRGDHLHAKLLETLALVVHRRGRREEAEDLHDRAEAAWIELVGEEHPFVAQHAFNRGVQRHEAGDLDGAFAQLERAYAMWGRARGPRSHEVASTLVAMANVEQDRGDLDAAQEDLERARVIYSSDAIDSNGPALLDLDQTLGMLHWRREQWQQAHAAWQRAIDELGDRDPMLALLLRANQGEALVEMGEPERAREHYRELFEAAAPMGSVDAATIAGLHKGAGLAALAQGERAQAMEHLELALAGFGDDPGLEQERADTMWALARALTGANGDASDRASELALGGAEIYRRHGRVDEANDIDAWTRAHAKVKRR